MIRLCNYCKKEFKGKQGKRYCSVSCVKAIRRFRKIGYISPKTRSWKMYWEYKFQGKLPKDEKEMEQYRKCEYDLHKPLISNYDSKITSTN